MAYTIHQFSTGIDAGKTDDGQWYSRAFTGRWMNDTSPVPPNIDLAIKHGDFEARSSSSVNPAIIGRIVPGDDNKFWSVVAIVTQGRDESRIFPAYRYFWCEGKDTLCLIVGWLLEQNHLPIFNPFDTSQPSYISEENSKGYREQADSIEDWINHTQEVLKWLTNSPLPIITTPNYTKFSVIDRMAHKIAKNRGGLTYSWSYQVETLGNPERFLTIQPSTDEAFKKMQSSSSTSVVFVESTIEAELQSVIQDLNDSAKVNLVNLKKLDNLLIKLQNTQNSQDILYKVFDDLGTINAFQDPFYKSGIMEQVTMTAILLPETLLEYLQYAHIEEKTPTGLLSKLFNSIFSDDNGNHIKQHSLFFQSSLYREIKSADDKLPNLIAKLKDGLITIIEGLFYKKISIEIAFWLINNEKSLWSLGRDLLIKSVKLDLQTIHNDSKQFRIICNDTQLISKVEQLNLKIWFVLIKYYWIPKINQQINKQINNEYLSSYKPLVKVFYKSTMLVFYFSEISRVDVHEQIIKKLQSQDIISVFGIDVTHKINLKNQGNESSNKWVEYFNIIVCIIAIFVGLVVIVNVWWVKLIFGVVALFWTLLFYEFATIRNFIKAFSLSLIIIAFICGNSSSQYLSIIPQPKTTPSPTPTSSSSSEGKANSPPEQQRQKILDKAVDSFRKKDKTYNAIEQIKKNLSDDKQLISIPSLRFNFQQDKDTIIISALNKVLFQSNYDYQDIDEYVNNNPNNSEGIKQKLNPLVKAIYEYQKNNKNKIYSVNTKDGKQTNTPPDGIIDLVVDKNGFPIPHSTMAVLQNDK